MLGDLLEHTNPELHRKINTPATPGGDSPADELGTEECLTEDELEELNRTHREMTDVLNILVTSFLFDSSNPLPHPRLLAANGDWTPALLGTWKRDFPYNRWEKVT